MSPDTPHGTPPEGPPEGQPDGRPDPNLFQRRAADPRSSVWVAASAGSGKTKVLTDRVLALLVDGADPAGLLCITFTKAAAAEMSNRIHARLAKWTRLGEAELSDAVRRLDGGEPTADRLARARKLFAEVLDLPGGLRIRTIHAFCQSVLGRFPLEAGVSPNFTAMDEREAAEAMRLARDTVLRAAAAPGPLADALAAVTDRAGEDVFAGLLAALAGQRRRLAETLRREGGIEGTVAALNRALESEPDLSETDVIAEACAPGAADEAALRAAVGALAAFGSDKNKDKAKQMEAWLNAAHETRIARFEAYLHEFLTKTEYTPVKSLCVKAVRENSPDAEDALLAEQARLIAVDARIRRQATARASEGLLRLGEAILRAYADAKRATARLDYDDLIHATAALLSAERVPWVLFKLDGGLSHLLIDEAQDTSPDQRAIVDALVAEFFSGAGREEGAGQGPRTLFVVGDAKQSIFSFQGADPDGYRLWRDRLDALAAAGRQAIRPVDMQISFRSVQAVLDAVDATFAEPPASDGVTDPDAPALKHIAYRAGLPGQVELWPPTEPPERIEDDLFAPPAERDAAAEADATRRLADGLAAEIARWIAQRETLPARGRPIRAGDILFLVRRRSALVGALARALTERGVPVAGVDRIVLTDQIAVMDLLALGRALLLPEDDLTFACLLKSPFLGLDDADLIALAEGREGKSLYSRLQALGRSEPRYAAAADWIADLLAAADRMPPFELFQRALLQPCPGPGGAPGGREVPMTGRQALIARLGTEAADPLEEFLSLALDYERAHTPSLEGFLFWVAHGNTDLKRDLEAEARDEVRIMTAHGAKGLQAPIVILPDALAAPGGRGGGLRWTDDAGGPAAAGLPVWTPSPAKRFEEPVAAGLKAAAEAAEAREARRLLYVAMTRAEDRLIVTGRLGRSKPPAGSWYELVAAGLDRLADAAPEAVTETEIAPAEGWQGVARIYRSGHADPKKTEAPRPDADLAAAEPCESPPLPAWLTAPPSPEPAPPRPLTPSRPGRDDPAVRSPLLAAGDALGLRRGRLIHRLLQSLPDLPEKEREAAARRFLALPGHDLTAEQQQALADEALAVLAAPDFAAIFGPGSRAEVPVSGLLTPVMGGPPVSVSGQVDRLLVGAAEILIVDYKTLRPAPAEPEAVPPAYLAQMAQYRAVLRAIYPDRPVRCALVFTETPRLVALPDALLDGVLREVPERPYGRDA
jgi:ATP-dependent helicase/nuclease subunit A